MWMALDAHKRLQRRICQLYITSAAKSVRISPSDCIPERKGICHHQLIWLSSLTKENIGLTQMQKWKKFCKRVKLRCLKWFKPKKWKPISEEAAANAVWQRTNYSVTIGLQSNPLKTFEKRLFSIFLAMDNFMLSGSFRSIIALCCTEDFSAQISLIIVLCINIIQASPPT